jgi:hypothetical protein
MVKKKLVEKPVFSFYINRYFCIHPVKWIDILLSDRMMRYLILQKIVVLERFLDTSCVHGWWIPRFKNKLLSREMIMLFYGKVAVMIWIAFSCICLYRIYKEVWLSLRHMGGAEV